MVRLISEANPQKCANSVQNCEWYDIYFQHDVKEYLYRIFELSLQNCFKLSFSEVRLSRKRARDKKWITRGLKCSIKHKHKLFKRWKTTHSEKSSFGISKINLLKLKSNITMNYSIIKVIQLSSYGVIYSVNSAIKTDEWYI